jgi:hypothetical protein
VKEERIEKLNKRGFGYIWHAPKENSVGRMCKFKVICSDTECHCLADTVDSKLCGGGLTAVYLV